MVDTHNVGDSEKHEDDRLKFVCEQRLEMAQAPDRVPCHLLGRLNRREMARRGGRRALRLGLIDLGKVFDCEDRRRSSVELRNLMKHVDGLLLLALAEKEL